MEKTLLNGLIIDKKGNKNWYRNGKHHREEIDPVSGEELPAIESANGDRSWVVNGQYHRNHGPAIITMEGAEAWYQHGKMHRENGPAIIYAHGLVEWYVEGIKLTDEQIDAMIEKEKLNQTLHAKNSLNLSKKQKI